MTHRSVSTKVFSAILSLLMAAQIFPLAAMFTNSSGMGSYNIPLIDFTNDPILDTKYDKG